MTNLREVKEYGKIKLVQQTIEEYFDVGRKDFGNYKIVLQEK